MIWAQSYEVAKVVTAARRNRCDVVNVNPIVETTNNAAIVVAQDNLRSDESPHTPLPVAGKVSLLGVEGGKAQEITEIAFLELARESQDSFAAVGASCFGFVFSAGGGYKSLPFTAAIIVAASLACVFVGVTDLERFAAHGATQGNVTALIVAVVFAAVLVKVDVSALLTWVFVTGHNFATTAGAIDNFGAGIY